MYVFMFYYIIRLIIIYDNWNEEKGYERVSVYNNNISRLLKRISKVFIKYLICSILRNMG